MQSGATDRFNQLILRRASPCRWPSLEGAPRAVVGQARSATASAPSAATSAAGSAAGSRTRGPQLVSVGIGTGICPPLERRRVELAAGRAPGLRACGRCVVESSFRVSAAWTPVETTIERSSGEAHLRQTLLMAQALIRFLPRAPSASR